MFNWKEITYTIPAYEGEDYVLHIKYLSHETNRVSTCIIKKCKI